jgi:hypothetical protein
MRLNVPVAEAIADTARECLREGRLLLFGSRLDAARRGGDIDLFWETTLSVPAALEAKIRFLARLHRRIGERRIDLVLQAAGQDGDRPIAREAATTGTVLWQG